ncbi:MAG: chorismate mutase [Bacteroidota bacterium]
MVNETFTPHLIDEFASNAFVNAGLVYKNEVVEKSNTNIFSLIKTEYKIPLAIYSPMNTPLQSYTDGYFSCTISPFNHQYIKSKNSEWVSFNLEISGKQKFDIKGILNQLSDYFILKATLPKTEAIIEISNFTSFSVNSKYFNLLQKVGINNYLIAFSKENIVTLKQSGDLFLNNNLSQTTDKSTIFDMWRSQIDVLDNILIETLNQRMQIVNEMGNHKKQNNLPLFEPQRWQQIVNSRKEMAHATEIDVEMITKIFEAIHLAALRRMIEIEFKN